MAASSSSTKFACPSCRKQLAAPLDVVGSQVVCPSCSTPILVPAARAKQASALPKLAAAAVVVVLGAGAFSALRGSGGKDGVGGTPAATEEALATPSTVASGGERPTAAAPTTAAGEPKDAALKLGLPRSGAKDFDSMVRHYGFDRNGGYRLRTPTGESVSGTYRDKKMVMVVGGAYHVSTKIQAGVGLIQPKYEKWAAPVEVLIDAPKIKQIAIAEGDEIEFVGIQEGVLDAGILIPAVRVLGLRNQTTREFFNFEPPTLPLGEVPGVNESRKAREAAASLKEVEAAEAKNAAEKAEVDRKAEAERKEREDKEWLESLKKR